MLNEIIFAVLALFILVGAIKMLAADEPVHAAIYLGLVLAGVAGIYLTLGAELLAAIQLLIYVGAVVTLILFAVMLTTHASPTEGYAEDRTPLSTLGIEGAPQGMDVESLEEVPPEADTIDEAEQHAQLERRDEETVRRDVGTQPVEDDHEEPERDDADGEEAETGTDGSGPEQAPEPVDDKDPEDPQASRQEPSDATDDDDPDKEDA